MLRILSLGAGVQSSTIALMAAAGEIGPLPDAAIFADTGSEPSAVYRHLAWLMSPGVLPFKVHIIHPRARSLGAEILAATRGEKSRGSHARPPFFVALPNGKRGMIRRQCTGDYKIDPIEKAIRGFLGLKYRQRWPKTLSVEQWIGISRDEASRMRESRRASIEFRYPLIELGMSRNNCLEWLERNGHPTPPKSACTFCPFHDDRTWKHLRDTDPAAWAEAVEIDRAIRTGLTSKSLNRGGLYLHGKLIPLEEVDLDADTGQLNWLNDCGGHCGV